VWLQVPGCGKRYTSSGGIRYHLRNCSHEGLEHSAESRAQLALARNKDNASDARRQAARDRSSCVGEPLQPRRKRKSPEAVAGVEEHKQGGLATLDVSEVFLSQNVNPQQQQQQQQQQQMFQEPWLHSQRYFTPLSEVTNSPSKPMISVSRTGGSPKISAASPSPRSLRQAFGSLSSLTPLSASQQQKKVREEQQQQQRAFFGNSSPMKPLFA